MSSIPSLLAGSLAIGLCVTVCPSVLSSQQPPPIATAARPTGPIRLDGRLDDPAWSRAEPTTRFLQRDPDDGAPATQRTEVRVLIGTTDLYIGARLHDEAPALIDRRLSPRDGTSNADEFSVALDAYEDRRTAFWFRVTPSGSVADGVIVTGGSPDLTWDGVWNVATSVDSAGWSVEMQIPLSQLRYSRPGSGSWGVQFERVIRRRQERAWFAHIPRSEPATVARYGQLAGLADLPRAGRLELMPYLAGQSEHLIVAPGNPFNDGSRQLGRAGADLRMRITSQAALTATINPDFGQVEVDPAVVNLSTFETFFPERRPFFTEGASIFSNFGVNRAFSRFVLPFTYFSRRIGRAPQLSAGTGIAHGDLPGQSTIAAAAKLTGRTANGWTGGILSARTLEERAQIALPTGEREERPVEPGTSYFAGRVTRELGRGTTSIGALVTGVERNLDTERFAQQLRNRGWLGGIDFNHSWDRQRWAFDASVAATHVSGSAASIDLTQRASSRYLQRPDLGAFGYDPTRTSLTGTAFQMALTRLGGLHWLGSLSYSQSSPGFESNDLGFQLVTARRSANAHLRYVSLRPGPIFRNWLVSTTGSLQWNFDGDRVGGTSASLGLTGTLLSYWSGGVSIAAAPQVIDDNLTRGGVAAAAPAVRALTATLASDPRRPLRFSSVLSASRSTGGGFSTTISPGLTIQPSSAALITLQPTMTRSATLAQYVARVPDPLATGTAHERLVFASLAQTSLGLVTRISWTFSPTLNLQLYLQPLLVRGRYTDFKELLASREFRFGVYGEALGTREPVAGRAAYRIDPDGDGPAAAFTVNDPTFTLRSLRSNVVLRWDYLPGSALFLVWQHGRRNEDGSGELDPWADLDRLLHQRAENLVAVKVSYWLGV